MILKSIIKIIVTGIELVARVIAKILIVFGLWLPALYSVVFLIVCLARNIKLSSVSTYYFVGLIISCIFIALLEVIKIVVKRKKTKAAQPHKISNVRAQNVALPKKMPKSFTPLKNTTQTKLDAFAHMHLPQGVNESEQPLVFASRTDPDLYVYEYSNCLQFFRQNGDNIEFVETRYK